MQKKRKKKKKERKKEKKNLLTIKKITLEYNQHRTAFQCRQVFSHRLCWFCFVFQRSVIGTVTAVQNSCTAFLQSCEIAEVPWPYFQFFPSLCTNKRKKERKKKKKSQPKKQTTKNPTQLNQPKSPSGSAQTVTVAILQTVTVTQLSAKVPR